VQKKARNHTVPSRSLAVFEKLPLLATKWRLLRERARRNGQVADVFNLHPQSWWRLENRRRMLSINFRKRL